MQTGQDLLNENNYDGLAAFWNACNQPESTSSCEAAVYIAQHSSCGLEKRSGEWDSFCRQTDFAGEGTTPLHLAALADRFDIVSALYDLGADVFTCNEQNRSALHTACTIGSESIARFLMVKGVGPNVTDRHGCAPLHLAARRGYSEVVRTLLEAGASVTVRDASGYSPLMWAASNGKEKVVSMLINFGSSVNVVDSYNETPLHLAAGKGNTFVVQTLCHAGSDLWATNFGGRRPFPSTTSLRSMTESRTLTARFLQNEGVAFPN